MREGRATVEDMKHAALSPSRAKDFQQCPLKFRFRVIDRLPEPPSAVALRGTIVHAVLEELYLAPAAERTAAYALNLLSPIWQAHIAKDPQVLKLFDTPQEQEAWLDSARPLISNYFNLENPQRLQPKAREHFVNALLPSGLAVRGIVDRIDEDMHGRIRVVDYKTGKSPQPRFQDDALFQMRFYATAIYLDTGKLPARTQLIYLKDERILTYDPVKADVSALCGELDAIWSGITARIATKDFEPRQGPLCNWCYFKDICPAFGGRAPEMDMAGATQLLTAQRSSSSTETSS
ncbi:MAG: PD-(D/E)XK nuclease family protein [Trueperella sp.]|nr:PD-(D/E)XK nuclease family protein [Trueperella sp.]